MKTPPAYEIQSYIHRAIRRHNEALRAKMDAGEIEYDQFLKAAFPADAYSVISDGVQHCLDDHNEA